MCTIIGHFGKRDVFCSLKQSGDLGASVRRCVRGLGLKAESSVIHTGNIKQRQGRVSKE